MNTVIILFILLLAVTVAGGFAVNRLRWKVSNLQYELDRFGALRYDLAEIRMDIRSANRRLGNFSEVNTMLANGLDSVVARLDALEPPVTVAPLQSVESMEGALSAQLAPMLDGSLGDLMPAEAVPAAAEPAAEPAPAKPRRRRAPKTLQPAGVSA